MVTREHPKQYNIIFCFLFFVFCFYRLFVSFHLNICNAQNKKQQKTKNKTKANVKDLAILPLFRWRADLQIV